MAKSSYSIAVDVELRAQAKSIDSFIKGLEQRVTDANISDRLFNISGNTINKMRKELDKANELLTHDTLSGFEAGQLEKSYRAIEKLYNNLFDTFKKSGYKELGFDEILTKQFEDATDKIKKVQKQKEKAISSTKTKDRLDASALSKASQFKAFDQDANLSQNIGLLREESKAVDQLKEKYGSLADVKQKVAVSQQVLNDVDNEIARFKTSTSYKQYSRVQSAEKFGALTRRKGDTYKNSFDQIQSWFKDAVESYGSLGDLTQANNLAGQIFLSVMGFDQQLDSATINQYAQMNVDQVVQAFNTKVSELLSKQGNQRNKVGDLLNNQLFGQNGFKKQAETYVVKNRPQISGAIKTLSGLEDKRLQASEDYANLTDVENRIAIAENNLSEVVTSLIVSLANLRQEVDKVFEAEEQKARQEFDDLSETQKLKQTSETLGGGPNTTPATLAKKEMGSRISSGILRQQQDDEAENFKKNLQQSIKQWMSVREVIGLVKNGIRQAYQDIQGLDKAMTNIAVVTDFSVSDLWGKINEYMSIAQQYGVTTQGVYEVSQLYFQQGLGEADTMAATVETLKMARIAGMDYAEAADGMTVAIRGFNMEMTEAAHVTDVYSKVAAITASDTQELVTAMSKTASSAAAVGSSFENTTAMLAVMIEATRESPQNLGSALKSIISRYGEMTKGLTEDSEGEEIDYNRVDTALKTVGISLKDAQGQFRDFDTVIEELSAKWDTLDSVTQRYIATIFAGNRQQSRFLALVSNYDRYMEVSEAAANSEDAGLLQYSKTLDSLETKLNNISTSFQQFYMSIFNGPTVGAVLDFINNLIKGFNKLGKISSVLNIGSIVGAIKVIGTIIVSDFAGAFSQISGAWKATLKQMTGDAGVAGTEAGNNYTTGFNSKNTGGNTLSLKGSKIATGAMLAGSALTLGGSALTSKNQFGGAILSSAGNALSIGSQLAMINPLLGVIGGAVAGLVTLVTSLPDSNAKALEKLEKIKAETEEKNIERAETKEDYISLKNGIEKIEELNRIKYDSDENYQAWIEANNSLIEAYPSMLGYIDEAGNSIADLSNSTEMLSISMQKAAEASRDYYVNKVKEIQMGIDNNRDYAFKNNSADSTFWEETWSGFLEYWVDPSLANPDTQGYSFNLTDGSHLSYGGKISVEKLKHNFDLAGIDLFQKLREINASTEEQLNNDWNFKLLKEIGAITQDDSGVWNFQESLEGYLTAEKQLQEMYATKQAAMQSGINLASLQSTMDDSVSSIEGYSSLIVELGKIHSDFDNFSYLDLANLDVETYEAIASPFINLYDSLSSTKQQVLSSLGGELLNFSLDDLITHLSDTFGVTEGSVEYGGIYQAYINNWKKQNYLAQQKLFNSIWGTPEMEIDSYSEWLKSDVAPEFAEGTSTEEKKEAYRLWVQQQIASFAEGRDELFDLLFEQDSENGGFKMKVSANEAEQISQFVADQESMAEKSTNIFIRDAAEARRETLTQLFAQMGQINFNSRTWRGSAELTAAEEMFGINMADWEESDVLSFKNLLVDSDAGSTEWQGKLNELAQKYNETIDWNGASLSELLYTSFSTQINTALDGMSDILSGISDLSSSQEKGFDWEESQKILKQLDDQTWEDVFETTEDGLIVLKDYNKTLDDLYSDDAQKFKDLAAEIKDLTEVNTETGLLDTQIAAFKQLKQFREQGVDLTDPANQEHLASQLTTILGISDSLAGDIISWASTAENVTQESFDAYLESLFGSATAAAEYLGNMIDKNKQEAAYNKYYKDNYGAIDKAREAIESPSLEAIKDYAITTGKIEQYKDSKGNYDWARYFSELEGDSAKGFNISKFGTVTVTDATAAVEALTGKTAEEFTIAENLLVDLFTQNLTQTLEGISEEVKSLATQFHGGGNIDISDVQNTFSSFLGEEVSTENWTQLLLAITSGSFELFSNTIKNIRPETKDSEIETMWGDYTEGVTVGTWEYTSKLIENQEKVIKGEFSAADLADMEDGALKDAIKAFMENTSEQFSNYTQTVALAYANKRLTFDDASSYLTSGYEAEFDRVFSFETDIASTLAETDSWDRGTAAKFLGQLNTLTGDSYSLQEWFQQRADGTFELIKSEEELLNELDQIDDKVAKQQIKDSYNFLKGWHKQTKKESALSELEGLATQSEFTATEIRDFYSEQLNQIIDVTTAEDIATCLKALDPMTRLNEWVAMYQDAGITIDQNKYQQLVSLVLDSILESISSGISSLSAGLEGTLGAADYQALVTKYGLTGSSTLTSKGVRLSREDQGILNRKLAYEAKQNGMIEGYGDQLWEVWRDSDNDPFKGYNDLGPAIEEAVKYAESLKDETQEAQDEAWAYVEALQQARHAAMFDEDSVEFAFMEQDATEGLTKNFDSFVDNIDKVKSSLEGLRDSGEMGYNDFFNVVDYIGNSGQWEKVSQQLGVSGMAIEDFAYQVVSATKTIGKVDTAAFASLGIDISAATTAMAEGMQEGLKETAQQQIKYLTGLEQMLMALAALEALGKVDFGIELSFDFNGDGTDGPDEKFFLSDFYEKWQLIRSLPEGEQKNFILSIETQLKLPEGSLWNLFGGTNSENKDIAALLIDTIATDNIKVDTEVLSKLMNIALTGEGISLANILEQNGIKIEDLFTTDNKGNRVLKDNAQQIVSELLQDILGELGKQETWNQIVNDASLDSKIQSKLQSPIELEGFGVKISYDKGIKFEGEIPKNADGTIKQEFIDEFKKTFGEEFTVVIPEDGTPKIVYDTGNKIGIDGKPIEGGEVPVKAAPIWQLDNKSAGTLTQALQEQFGAPIIIDVPVQINPVSADVFAKIKETEEVLAKVKQDYSSQGKDSPLLGQYDFASLIANLENQLAILRGTTPIEGIQQEVEVPFTAKPVVTWSTLINATNDVASIIQNSIDQFITIPLLATPKVTWTELEQSGTTPQEKINLLINNIVIPNIDREVVASLGLDTEKSTVNITAEQLSALVDQKIEEIKNIENKENTEANKIIDLGKEFDVLIKIGEILGLEPAEIIQQWKEKQVKKEANTADEQQGIDLEIDVKKVLINSIASVTGLTSEQIQSALGENYTVENLAVLASVILGLGSGENGQSSIEDTGFIQAIIDYVNGRAAEPVTVQTTATVDTTNENIDESSLIAKILGFKFTPVDITVPVVVKVALNDKGVFDKALEDYKNTYFNPKNKDSYILNSGSWGQDIIAAFENDPMTKAFAAAGNLENKLSSALYDYINQGLNSDSFQYIQEDVLNNFFGNFGDQYTEILTSIEQLPSTLSTLSTTIDSATFVEIANALQTAANAAEQLSSHLSNITLPADGGEESPLSTLLNAFNPEGEEMAEVPILAKVNKIELTPLANKPVELTGKITKLDFSDLKKKENEKITPEIDTEKIEEGVKETEEQLEELNEKEISAKVGAETTEAEEGFEDVKDKAEEVDTLNPIVEVDIKDNATEPFNAIMAALQEKASQGITIPVNVSGGGVWTGMVNNISGPAFAEGNTSKLHSGASLANKTLVGELGPELAVYDGRYHLLGSAGAEFVKLPKDALVFNHLQTRGIMNGQMNGARAKVYGGRAQSVFNRMTGTAMATGNVSGPALAGGIGGALEAVRRAKSVWQGLLNSLSAADLLGGGGGGGGGGGNDESLKAHIEDLQEWYNLSRKIADIEQQINTLLAKRENLTDGHEYLKNLRATQALLEDQVNTQTDLMRFQEKQLKAQADFINNHDIWSKFLNVDENGLLQYNEGNETNGGKGALKVLQDLNEMSGSQQLKYITKTLGWSYTNTDGEELEDEELVAKFFEELQKQIDDYDALHDTVAETTQTLEELETEINEIEKEIRENEIELSQEIYDIIVDAWKENIDNLKKQNDLIKEANDAYAEGIQKALDAEREEYDNNQAIQEREQLQRQLSLLRRSGGSASEIADLEQQLNETLKDEYFRNQEQALDTIRDANERQVELMEQQVKIQEETLEYQQEQGIIWQKVYEVMQGTDAEILDFMQGNSTEFFEKSSLVQQDMLTEWAKMVGIYNEDKVRDYYAAQAEENINQAWDTERGKGLKDVYDSASKKDRDNWNREYYEQYAKAMMEGATETEALTKAQEELYEHLEEYKKAMEERAKEEKKKKSSGGGSSSSSSKKTQYYYVEYKDADGNTKRVGYNSSNKEQALAKAEKEKKKRIQAALTSGSSVSLYTGTANSIGPARYNGTLVGEFGMELGVWNDKWHLLGKNGPEMRYDIPNDALIFNHLQTAGILSGQYSDDFFSRKLSDIPNQLNASHTSALSNISSSDESSILNIEPGAVVVQVSQLNDKYDVNELYNDITDRIYSIASQSSGRGVRRR